jgi:HD-like signal output (HDOD) protein
MKLEQLFQQPQAVPVIPQVLQQLIVALGNDSVQPTALARLIESDPAICARLLQLANSVVFQSGTRH